jgi:hypothetical protein
MTSAKLKIGIVFLILAKLGCSANAIMPSVSRIEGMSKDHRTVKVNGDQEGNTLTMMWSFCVKDKECKHMFWKQIPKKIRLPLPHHTPKKPKSAKLIKYSFFDATYG